MKKEALERIGTLLHREAMEAFGRNDPETEKMLERAKKILEDAYSASLGYKSRRRIWGPLEALGMGRIVREQNKILRVIGSEDGHLKFEIFGSLKDCYASNVPYFMPERHRREYDWSRVDRIPAMKPSDVLVRVIPMNGGFAVRDVITGNLLGENGFVPCGDGYLPFRASALAAQYAALEGFSIASDQ